MTLIQRGVISLERGVHGNTGLISCQNAILIHVIVRGISLYFVLVPQEGGEKEKIIKYQPGRAS